MRRSEGSNETVPQDETERRRYTRTYPPVREIEFSKTWP